jgi:hypothetical protein
MRKLFRVFLLLTYFPVMPALSGQSSQDEPLPVRGFSIAAPKPEGVNQFVTFIDEELAARRINVLILRVDYGYQYRSHPELQDSVALSEQDVKKPRINLLGHQSWAGEVGNLLKVYPEFDETPSVKMPENYEWPNEDGLYCKSYCPLHPGVHNSCYI